MKCVAFITPAVTVIAHSRSAECRLPVCQTACYAEQPGPLCSTTAALHILHSIAYRPPVVALSVQRQQHELGADVTALQPELSSIASSYGAEQTAAG